MEWGLSRFSMASNNDSPTTHSIIDWDQRKTFGVTVDGGNVDAALAAEFLARHVGSLSPDTCAIKISSDGKLLSASSNLQDDVTLEVDYPTLAVAEIPEGVATIRRSALHEIRRLLPCSDLVYHHVADNRKEISEQYLFKYSFVPYHVDSLWDELQLHMRLPKHPSIVSFDKVVVDELQGRVVGYTSRFDPVDTVLENKRRVFKLKYLQQLIDVVDLLNLRHGIAHQDIISTNLRVDDHTDNIVLHNFSFSARIGAKGHKSDCNDVNTTAFTIYEIVTGDSRFQSVPRDQQNIADIDGKNEWVQGADRKLDSPISEFQSILAQWLEKRRSGEQITDYKQTPEFIDWPAFPEPPLRLSSTSDNAGNDIMTITQSWVHSRQENKNDGHVSISWERPAQDNIKGGSRILSTGQLARCQLEPNDPNSGIDIEAVNPTSQPQFYSPCSSNEEAPPLASAPLSQITSNAVLQPPLSRRGTGPGLILLLPKRVDRNDGARKSLDPNPIQKWAEEGFAVVGVIVDQQSSAMAVASSIRDGVGALQNLEKVDTKDKFGLVIYDDSVSDAILTGAATVPAEISCVITFTPAQPSSILNIPILAHISPSSTSTTPASQPSNKLITVVAHANTRQNFILPNAAQYDPSASTMAHTRNIVFLRKHLGGPHFDIEAIWEEHTYWEFERRSLSQTMATMVAQPYVNHIPTMAGGIGRSKLFAFYRDHFVFCNPPDTALNPVSRTVGPDRVVDEFILECTHTTHIPWLLPNLPPSGKRLSIPMVGVINVRGDLLYHEHIWWDQATALRQAGFLPTHLLAPEGVQGHNGMIRLPVAGPECARLLADETDGKTNEMLHPDWATQ